MMESSLFLKVTFPIESQAKWQALVEGLARNEHGAYFEEYAEAFGEQAETCAGDVLDVWQQERGEIDTRSSTIKAGSATIAVFGFRLVEESRQPMINFLKACGALTVTVQSDFDSERD